MMLVFDVLLWIASIFLVFIGIYFIFNCAVWLLEKIDDFFDN